MIPLERPQRSAMNLVLRPSLYVFSLLGLAAGADAQGLRFAPSEGTVLSKQLSIQHELQLVMITSARDDMAGVPDGSSGWVSTWEKATFLDQYLKVANGRPELFQRTYSDLGSGGEANIVFPGPKKSRASKEQTVLFSSLHQRVVDFTWIEGEKDWARAYTKLEGEESLLGNVDADMDLLAALPPGPVKIGDSWDVPVGEINSFLAPGGVLALEPKKTMLFSRTMKIGVGGDVAELLGGAEGKIRATYKEDRTVDGAVCAVIKIEIEARSKTERTHTYRLLSSSVEKSDLGRLRNCDVTYMVRGEGEVLWDLAAGHFRSWAFDGDEHVVVRVDKSVVDGETDRIVITQNSEFNGKFKLSLTAGPPPAMEEGSTGAAAGADEKKDE